jgi:succinoglycan biosynthesis protein ExoA
VTDWASVATGVATGARPMVSLLVAMRNEETHIGRTLASILAQDYPSDRLEILIYDGQSTDRSWEIAGSLVADRPLASLSPNPGITQSAGWNLGIADARGDVIGIVSAHCELAPDYVSTAVETLERTGADMVGGLMRAVGDRGMGEAIALATSTPFGVGGARFHYTDVEEQVDTVYMGLCRSEVYRRLRFDEEMVRDQDDELSYRLLDQGGRIMCNPAIRSSYTNRPSLRSLWRQYFEYGYWKVRVMQKHPKQVRTRQLVPPAFVAVIIGASALAPFSQLGRIALAGSIGSYVVANVAASASASRTRPDLLPLLPFVFGTIHVAYGLGYLVGLLRFRPGRQDVSTSR